MGLVIGVDPGIAKCAVAIWNGEKLTEIEMWPVANAIHLMSQYEGLPETIIIEKPVPQGPRSARNSTFELVRIADRISQAALRAGLMVYEVPVNEIRRQAGYSTSRGKADEWVKRYLRFCAELSESERAAAFKRGGIFSNSDRRDAAMCALWNYKDARNQVYKVTR